jgi:hypothetical protein
MAMSRMEPKLCMLCGKDESKALLDRLTDPLASPEHLRTMRVGEALEYLGSPAPS